MMDTGRLFSPLLNHVCDEDECFSNWSSEHTELRNRLVAIQRYVSSSENALRQIARIASEKNHLRKGHEEILQTALDQIGLLKLAATMLKDINNCLASVEIVNFQEYDSEPQKLIGNVASNAELEEPLGAQTDDKHNGMLKAQTVKEEN
jgi:hypothetical protein